MTAKEYLSKIRLMDVRLKNKQNELTQLRDLSVSLSIKTDGDRVQASHSKDGIANIVTKIVDDENEIKEMYERYMAERSQIINMIESIDDPDLYDVLHKRYVQGKTWEKIAVEMNVSIQHCYRLHGHALQEITKKMRVNESRKSDMM